MTLPRVPRGPSRAGESEMFSTLAPRNGHRWLAFSGSLIGHVASVTLCAAYLQFLATHPEPPLFARRTMIPPMEIRLPETMAALEVLRPKLTDEDYWKLKLLVHTHDSFKAESQPGHGATFLIELPVRVAVPE